MGLHVDMTACYSSYCYGEGVHSIGYSEGKMIPVSKRTLVFSS